MDATGWGPAPAYQAAPKWQPRPLRLGVPGNVSLVRSSAKAGSPRGDERRSGRGSTLELNDDRDRAADRKTKIAVRAALVDRDFGKPVRVLVPEGRAGRPIAERPRVLEHAARRGELGVGRQHRRAQARSW